MKLVLLGHQNKWFQSDPSNDFALTGRTNANQKIPSITVEARTGQGCNRVKDIAS